MSIAKFKYTPYYICLAWLFICGSSFADDLIADNNSSKAVDGRPAKVNSEIEWVAGIGLGVFDYHLYPGAVEKNRLILPVPYFTFRSPKFEVDRGIKSFLYNSEVIVLDVSADFGLPVDSNDVEVRQDMPDLDLTLQLGLSVGFLLNNKHSDYFDVRFEIPLRVAFATDFRSVEHIGYLLEPRISFNHRRSTKSGIAHKGVVGIKFATQDYHAYYYDVATEFATATREEFTSDGGFGGGFARYRISYKTTDFIYWAFIRYQSLRGAEFEDSPLVVQKDYYLLGVGFAWIFANSL